MLPNLRDDQMLLVNVNAYFVDLNRLFDWLPGMDHKEARPLFDFGPPARGDIVVFDPPVDADEPYIKRVIGLPGEEVRIEGGDVYVNGERLAEPYLMDPDTGEGMRTSCDRRQVCRVTLDEGQVFVLGDNRSGSSDSREFGPVAVRP
jgi:signal peptidase I